MISLRPDSVPPDVKGVVDLWRLLKAMAAVVATLGVLGGAVRWYVRAVVDDVAVEARLAGQRVETMQAEVVATQGRQTELQHEVERLEAELYDEVAARVRLQAGMRGFDPTLAGRAGAKFVEYTRGAWPCLQGAPCANLRAAAQASVDAAKAGR